MVNFHVCLHLQQKIQVLKVPKEYPSPVNWPPKSQLDPQFWRLKSPYFSWVNAWFIAANRALFYVASPSWKTQHFSRWKSESPQLDVLRSATVKLTPTQLLAVQRVHHQHLERCFHGCGPQQFDDTCILISNYIYIYMYICINVYMYINIYIYMYMLYIYIYIWDFWLLRGKIKWKLSSCGNPLHSSDGCHQLFLSKVTTRRCDGDITTGRVERTALWATLSNQTS